MRRFTLGLALASILALLLVGCGPSTDDNTTVRPSGNVANSVMDKALNLQKNPPSSVPQGTPS